MSYEQQSEYISRKLQFLSKENFVDLALEVFNFQAGWNEVYARFLSLLRVEANRVATLEDIPFLPIQFFKNYSVKTGNWPEKTIFTSSGTTGNASSRHFVREPAFYLNNTVKGFQTIYGDPSGFCFLALLPSYLERKGSSLIAMADHFIRLSRYPQSGFFLNNISALRGVLQEVKKQQVPTILLGVSFALLDLAESGEIDLEGVTIMETGGMKGRRKEMTRNELHRILKDAFHVPYIHSEYGMTELFSQAYSKGEGIFYPAPTMQLMSREITDPLAWQQTGRTGALNIIDLANFNTCSFIATDDLGRVHANGSFEVLGRLDDSDIRGCNLLLGADQR